jgi:hypothetical protein
VPAFWDKVHSVNADRPVHGLEGRELLHLAQVPEKVRTENQRRKAKNIQRDDSFSARASNVTKPENQQRNLERGDRFPLTFGKSSSCQFDIDDARLQLPFS